MSTPCEGSKIQEFDVLAHILHVVAHEVPPLAAIGQETVVG